MPPPIRQYRFTLVTTGYTVTQLAIIQSIQELFGLVDNIFFQGMQVEPPKYILQTQEFRLARDDRIKFQQLMPERDYQHFLIVPLMELSDPLPAFEDSDGSMPGEVHTGAVVDLG